MSYNHVTHYDPFMPTHDPYGEDGSEYGYCGTYLFDGNVTNDKELVSCKKCIKKFSQADQEKKDAIQANCDDMQGFMDFQKEELKKKISAFIEDNSYTWTVEKIITEYHEKYSKGFYVSHTCKLIIQEFETELKYT